MQRKSADTWFTDKKKFCQDNTDITSYYWHDLRKDPVALGKRQAGGGGVMVWAGVSSAGKTSLCFTSHKLNAIDYQNILDNHFLPFHHAGMFWFNIMHLYMVQTRPRTDWEIKISTLFLGQADPLTWMWSKTFWGYYYPTFIRVQSNSTAIMSAWNRLHQQTINKLISSMPDQIFNCILVKWSYTKY